MSEPKLTMGDLVLLIAVYVSVAAVIFRILWILVAK